METQAPKYAVQISDPNIPIHKIKQFQEILSACHGRFEAEPFKCFNNYHVRYSFQKSEDSNEFHKRWRAVTEDVIEKPAKAKRRLDNLFGLLFWIR